MSRDESDQERLKADRRAFLEKCGRFAIVTPPVVTLMLATDSTKKALAASGNTTLTVTTATTATTLSATTSTVTVTVAPSPTNTPATFEGPEGDNPEFRMRVASMAVMKPS